MQLSTADSAEAELVIVGAGFSGLNALRAAREYIPKPGRIVIADERSNYGGHWIDSYDFVRLHQPYKKYTSYDESWDLDKPLEYLATKDEVLNHLRDLGRRAGAEELFGYRYIGHDKVQEIDDLLEISFRVVGNYKNILKKDGECNGNYVGNSNGTIKIYTKRLIICCPVSHRVNKRLQLSSSKVESIDIRELSSDVANDNGKRSTHYLIVGSGKSAMDAIAYIHDNCELNKTTVSMISGNGVAFINREKMYPSSWFARHFGRVDPVWLVSQYVLKWDGTNQASLMREMERDGYLISAVSKPQSCVFGFLSPVELEKVNRCLGEIIKGRMITIVDSTDGCGIDVVMECTKERVPLKSFKAVQRTVVVNCTESENQIDGPRPLVLDGGKTLDIQLVTIEPGQSAAYLTHTWLLGKLEGEGSILTELKPLILPHDHLNKKDCLYFKGLMLTLYNFQSIMKAVPLTVFRRDKSNELRWCPPWIQMRAIFSLTMFVYPEIKKNAEKSFADLRFPAPNVRNQFDGK